MKESDIYNNFIDKWQNRLGNTSILQNQSVLRRVALPYNELQQRMGELATRSDLTFAQRQQMMTDVTDKKYDVMSNAYANANAEVQQQRNKIENNVMTLEEKRDLAIRKEKEAEQLEKKRRAANMVKTGLTIAGTVVGTAIAPGVGTKIGGTLGSAAGNAIVGLDKSYHEPDAILQGGMDLMSAYSTFSGNKKISDINGLIKRNMDKISGFDEWKQTLFKLYVEQGNFKGLESLFKGVSAMPTRS